VRASAVVAWWACASACGSPSPIVHIQVTPDGQAVVGATRMTFTADSAHLSPTNTVYTWTFGDGGTATGPEVDHVFLSEGTFVVTVSASGGGRRAESTASVTARSLTGNWSRPDGGGPAGFGFYFALVQRGTELDGEINSPSLCPVQNFRPPFGTIQGRAGHPRIVTWTLMCGGVEDFSGTVAPDLNSITGMYGSRPQPFTYVRDR
jgi:hypothetical protein